jgi:hypothetical protein
METKPFPDKDYDALARRYLELWQEQIAAWAQQNPAPGSGADAEKLVAQFAGQFTGMATAWMDMMQGALKSAGGYDASRETTTPWTPPPPVDDGAGGVDPAVLLRRIDELERRLAVAEAKPGKSSGRAHGGAAGGNKPKRRKKS